MRKTLGDFRLSYCAPLVVYFAYGANSFTAIAMSFWEKKQSGLSPEFLLEIGFWAGLPWTVKMIFGQFADSVEIFGSRRKIYVVLGALFMAGGQFIIIELVRGSSWLLQYGTVGAWYLAAAIINAAGFMIQDVIADTMTVEVIPRIDPATGLPRSKEDIDKELSHIQWLGRLVMMSSAAIGAFAGGIAAKSFGYHAVVMFALGIPAVSLLGCFLKTNKEAPRSRMNWSVIFGGVLLGVFIAGMRFIEFSYAKEVVLAVSIVVVSILIARLGIVRSVVYAAIVIFLFRAVPGVGPGIQWWQMDTFDFDEEFYGSIGGFGTVLAFIGLLALRKPIEEKPIRFSLLWLTVAGTVVSIPNVGLYYGMPEWLGMSPKTFVWFDTAISAPLAQLSMVPLLALTAKTCPPGQQGTWFALMASLMNMALSASQLGTRYLYYIFPIARGSYENVGAVLIWSLVIGMVVPLLAILVFLRKSDSL